MTAGHDPDGFVDEELGELYLLQNRRDMAREYFRKAHSLLEKVDWLVKSEPARFADQELGRYFSLPLNWPDNGR